MRAAPHALGLASLVFALVSSCSGGGGGLDAPPGAGASEADAQPPVLSNVELELDGFEQIRVTWTTDEPSTARAELGTNGVFDELYEVSPEPVREHAAVLEGVPPGTYDLRLVCVDAAGNEAVSEPMVAEVPDRRPPTISAVTVELPSEDVARISCVTDEPATCLVQWGPTHDLGLSAVGPEPTTTHVVELTGLVPGGTYYYRIQCADAAGNRSKTPIAVLEVADTLAPALLEVTVTPLLPDAAEIRWVTDEPASGRLEYGPTSAYGEVVERPELATSHTALLSGLPNGGKVHFSIQRTDAAGNTQTGPDQSFQLDDVTPPVVSAVAATVLSAEEARVTWETDELATSRVEYGTTDAYGSATPTTGALTQDHSVTLGGLAPGTTYHYRVVSEDPLGNLAASPDQTFSTPDPHPPVLFGVAAAVVAPGLGVVIWGTDEPASSFVQYGDSPAMGEVAGSGAQLVTQHVVFLPNLEPGATIHYQPVSLDPSGNAGYGPLGQLLVTDDAPPVVSGLGISQLSQSEVLLSWQTDEPALYVVEYGTSAQYGDFVAQSSALETSHAAVLTGLDAGTYHYRITCADAAGNLNVGSDATFVVTDVTAPTVTQLSVDAASEEATLTWTTDEPATSVVLFGTSPAYGSTKVASASPATSHSATLVGLQPETTYHFTVACVDPAQNLFVGPDATFETEQPPADVEITGELVAWHPVTLTVHGPYAGENDASPNPFRDYRFTVRFTSPSGEEWVVPGFFDADGAGGVEGDLWRARLAPSEGGTWEYELLFQQGTDLAVDLDLQKGSPLEPHGTTGEFVVAARDPGAPGFYKWGLLEYVGEHYLKFRDGPYFLKNGVDGPENLLGYKGFDNTFDQAGGLPTNGLDGGVHRFLSHTADFGPGGLGGAEDPLFASADTGFDSRGMVGALNYLASVGINSIYFLPMNLGGDGRDTYPFVSPVDNTSSKTRYDVSKLAQWNRVFEHATRKGIQLHMVLAETEDANEAWLGSSFGTVRKLFFRELVARFGHNLAIKWNLSEESDFSQAEHEAFADYIRAVDPYDHPIAFHTHMLSSGSWYGDYEEVLGDPAFSMTAIQCMPDDVGNHVESWRDKSAATGHRWVVEIDEIGPAGTGLTSSNETDRRKRCLWDVVLSGGAVEWYFGYHSLPLGGDVRLEDFRTRDEMWGYTRHAHSFVTSLPFWEMSPRDELLSGEDPSYGGGEVFAKRHDYYAIYFPDASSTGSLDLTETSGNFVRRWFNPRSGNWVGGTTTVEAAEVIDNGPPPNSPEQDWVLLYERP